MKQLSMVISRSARLLLSLIAFLATPSLTPAQTTAPTTASTQPQRLTRIAPDVYFRFGDIKRGQANGGYIIGREYVIAIEAPNAAAAAEMLDEIKGITDKPLRYLIITHGHWDHDGGVDAFLQRGVTVICHETLRQRYLEKKKAGTFMGVRDRLTLPDAGLPIDIYTPGHLHSTTDVFIRLPDQGVLFTGDSVVNSPHLWMGESNVDNWINAIASLDRKTTRTVCPGHGNAGGPDVLDRLGRYLTSLRDEVGYQVAQGRSLEMTMQNLQLPDRNQWTGNDKSFADVVKAAYTQLTAPPPAPPTGPGTRALVLIGDHYHRPAFSRPPIESALRQIGVPAQFIYDVNQLNARTLADVKLLIVLRDGMNWPESDQKSMWWMTDEQEKALAAFVANGGGFLALHNATALRSLSKDPTLFQEVLGSSYNGHGAGDEKFTVRILNADHPVTRGVTGYQASDERHNPILHAENLTILLEAVSGEKRSTNGYVRTYGKGRVCYLATGHHQQMLELPSMQRLIANAAAWCSGVERP